MGQLAGAGLGEIDAIGATQAADLALEIRPLRGVPALLVDETLPDVDIDDASRPKDNRRRARSETAPLGQRAFLPLVVTRRSCGDEQEPRGVFTFRSTDYRFLFQNKHRRELTLRQQIHALSDASNIGRRAKADTTTSPV
jgi:hypothetical protein